MSAAIPVEDFFRRLNLPTEYPYSHLLDATTTTSNSMDASQVSFGMLVDQITVLFVRYLGSSYQRHVCLAVLPLIKGSTARVLSTGMVNNLCHGAKSNHGTEILKLPIADAILSGFYDCGPCLYAMCHVLWLMFAPIMLMISLSHLVVFYKPLKKPKISSNQTHPSSVDWYFIVISLIALLSSLLMMVDASYIFSISRQPLVLIFMITVGVVYYQAPNHEYRVHLIIPITLLSSILLVHSLDLDLPPETFKPGLYYDTTNVRSAKIAEAWPVENRSYTIDIMTKWTLSGDMRTLIPFLLNEAHDLPYRRMYVPVPDETEAVRLDIFSPKVSYSEKQPVYLISSGLNGGSNDAYVRDFIKRRTLEGSVVAVLVTRGLMDSQIVGDSLPDYARTSDIDAAAKVLRQAIPKTQMLVGVGYSMGAITLANYVAKSGDKCYLDAAISISGALNAKEQISYTRSRWLFQPVLAGAMKRTLSSKFGKKIHSRLGTDDYLNFMKASDIVSLDEIIARYHGYNDISKYYSDMSVIGNAYNSTVLSSNHVDRVADVAIPLLFVNALDDTFGSWRCLGVPNQVVKSGKGNVFLLITKHGGHVGWPTGLNPSLDAWKWMNNIPKSFIDAYQKMRDEV